MDYQVSCSVVSVSLEVLHILLLAFKLSMVLRLNSLLLTVLNAHI